jgi:hypothetical protein
VLTVCIHHREQVGVTTDLGSDPTLVRFVLLAPPLLILSWFRHIQIFSVHVANTQSESPDGRSKPLSTRKPLGGISAVFYQDQSKRKETRMILFFVCAKCNHSFTDPSLDNRPDAMEG